MNRSKQLQELEALRDSQRQLQTLMSNLPGIAYQGENDDDWTMTFLSEGCLNLTGYSREELMPGGPVSYGSLVHPDDGTRVWETVQEALEARRRFRITYRIRTRDGTEKWVWEQGCGIFDAKGKLLFLEGFITDITEQRRAEQALARQMEETRRAQEAAELARSQLGRCHRILLRRVCDLRCRRPAAVVQPSL